MYKIEGIHGSIYCKDADMGDILYEIENPAVFFSWSPEMGEICVHKLGDKSFVEKDYMNKVKKYTDARISVNDLYLCDLPKDVEILQNIYDNHNVLAKMFKPLLESRIPF